MIFTDRKITIRNGKSTINEPVILYRGDYEVSIKFTIMESKFRFKSGVNLVDSEKASHGQLAILTPYGGNVFSEIVKCEDGTVTFTLTKEMIDQLEEVGLYSFQIRLFDYYRESRVSIPPVEFGIEVREPVASEDHDNEVNNAIVGYSIAKVVDPKEENVGPTFDDNGQYNKTDWETGDRISEGKLNKIEDALVKINQNEKNDVAALDKRVTANFNVLTSQLEQKVNLNEVVRKGHGTLNDFDEETRSAILNNNNIDINYVLGKDNVRSENIAESQIDIYHTNFIKYDTADIYNPNMYNTGVLLDYTTQGGYRVFYSTSTENYRSIVFEMKPHSLYLIVPNPQCDRFRCSVFTRYPQNTDTSKVDLHTGDTIPTDNIEYHCGNDVEYLVLYTSNNGAQMPIQIYETQNKCISKHINIDGESLIDGTVKSYKTDFLQYNKSIEYTSASLLIDLETNRLTIYNSDHTFTGVYFKVKRNTVYTVRTMGEHNRFVIGLSHGIKTNLTMHIIRKITDTHGYETFMFDSLDYDYVCIYLSNNYAYPEVQVIEGNDFSTIDKLLLFGKQISEFIHDNALNANQTNFIRESGNMVDNDYIYKYIDTTHYTIVNNDLARSLVVDINPGRTYTIKTIGDHDRFFVGLTDSTEPGVIIPKLVASKRNSTGDEEITFTNGEHTKCMIYVSYSRQEPEVLMYEGLTIPENGEKTYYLNDTDRIIVEKDIKNEKPCNYYINIPMQKDCLGEENSFADSGWTSDEVINNLYEPLRERYPNYISRENIGKDSSGVYDMWMYVFEPKYYEQVVWLQSGVHPYEEDSFMALARIMDMICNEWDTHDDLAYLRWNVKFIVVPIVNVWGVSQPENKRTLANVNGVNLNRDAINQTQQESKNVCYQMLKYKDEISFMFDMHTTVNNTYGDYMYWYYPEAPNARVSLRTIHYLCDKNIKRKEPDLHEVRQCDYDTFHKFAWLNCNIPSATLEHSDYVWDTREHTSVCMTMAVESFLNHVVQHAKKKFKTID